MPTYNSFIEIIDAFGGSKDFGIAIGVPLGTASSMRTRDKIPPAHWDNAVRAAAAASLRGITIELLSRLYSAKSSEAA